METVVTSIDDIDITTTIETPVTSSYTTTTDLTIGSSEELLLQIHDDINTSNLMLAFVSLLLIVGWLYNFFANLFNQC